MNGWGWYIKSGVYFVKKKLEPSWCSTIPHTNSEGDHGPDTLLGEYLKEYRVLQPAINDVG